MVKGYIGRNARIDLTTGSIKIEQLSGEYMTNYIGGYGFAAKTLWDELKPGIDPLGPDNILIYNVGPFPGTPLPTSSKYGVFAKSPLTGLFGMAISSGSVGQQMRQAGLQQIIFTGKAEKPVFLFVDDGDIQLHDAHHYWGKKDSWETEEEIREEFGDERIAVASIGKAAENLSRIGCITNDRNRQAGRTGMGAVMGSKKLKAVAFRGTHEVTVAKPEEYHELCLDLIKRANGPATLKYRDLGTPINTLNFQKLGCLPTYNFREGTFDQAEAISGETMAEKWVVKKAACSNCPIACDHLCLVPEGPYKGSVSSVDFESIFALGSCCGVGDMDAIIRAIELCDRHTIDTMSGGVCVAFAMECFEKGYFTKEDCGGLDLKFGNSAAMVEFVNQICERSTKAGDIIAEGTKIASEKIGKDSADFAMHSKGLELPGYHLSALKTAAVGFSVSIRGGCHLRNGAYSPDVKGKFDRLTENEPEKRAAAIIGTENLYAVIDSYIICKFTRGIYKDTGEMASVYEMVTGHPFDEGTLLKTGERILNLSKAFNIREGWTRDDDTLPKRMFTEPQTKGPSKGVVVDRKGFESIKDHYYKQRGWDSKGIPTDKKLKELDLDFVIGKL
ncbi:aldehyde ferredoxin oxidoreductase [Candidatus Bathyarchaeota archaeon]|nr:aldehyde ferredoxin oxidoreductase [Candidatus Bathyarchaeota archaeon]